MTFGRRYHFLLRKPCQALSFPWRYSKSFPHILLLFQFECVLNFIPILSMYLPLTYIFSSFHIFLSYTFHSHSCPHCVLPLLHLIQATSSPAFLSPLLHFSGFSYISRFLNLVHLFLICSIFHLYTPYSFHNFLGNSSFCPRMF